MVRVCVRQVRERVTTTTIGPAERWLRIGPADAFEQAVICRGPIELRFTERGWFAADRQKFKWTLERGRTVQIVAISGGVAGAGEEPILHLDKQPYHGLFQFVPRCSLPLPPPDSTPPEEADQRGAGSEADDAATAAASREGFDIVNHVGMEAYLPGVVAKELYNRWHEQTHMAQAIAARSFACAEQQWFATRRHFDLMNTQASQAYVGATMHEKSRRAVAATAGIVLAYRHQLVPGYYSSCCGGAAASAIDAIGINPINDVAPLRGREEPDVCGDAPVFRWTAKQPRAQLVKRINAFGRHQGDPNLASLAQLREIAVTARNARGRPQRYALLDHRGGSIRLRAETLRQALNFRDDHLPAPSQPVKSSNLQADFAGKDVTFSGLGFGHGAGLCQYGAETLANRGLSFEAILRWYYPDVEMVESYQPRSTMSLINL